MGETINSYRLFGEPTPGAGLIFLGNSWGKCGFHLVRHWLVDMIKIQPI